MTPRSNEAAALVLWAAILSLSVAVGLAYEAWAGFLTFAGFCAVIFAAALLLGDK